MAIAPRKMLHSKLMSEVPSWGYLLLHVPDRLVTSI